MDKERLNQLLDSIYELEGLVHLAITREDMPEVLPDLILRKSRELLGNAEAVAGANESVAPVEAKQEPVPFDEPVSNDEPVSFDEPETVELTVSYDEPEPDVQPEVEPRGRLVFSLNDRYRFKRELFNQSDADFNTTLSLVASMDSYDEAEDYFLNELQWDSKSIDVIDFLEILKKYFKE